MEYAVLIGLVFIAIALYYGLTNIANALHSRRISVRIIHQQEEENVVQKS